MATRLSKTTAPDVAGTGRQAADAELCNEVRLVGRLPEPATIKTLPSGDTLRTFRVAVPRTVRPGQRRAVDSLECVVWNGRVGRVVERWRAGDRVEVSGSLRRRFFQTAAGTGSRVEVEVTEARRRRGPT